MKELFEFHMMQTDPNWSNFLWNEQRQQVRHGIVYPPIPCILTGGPG